MTPLCRVYWGSHGCSLNRDHAERGHQCGLVGDEDGLCSRIDWDPAEEVWVQRFSTVHEGWDADLFPAAAFGEDLPEELDAPAGRVDALRQRWQDEGLLAVWENGGWVKRVRPS